MENLTKLSPIATVIAVSEDKQDMNGRDFKTLRLQGITKSVEVIGGVEYPVTNRGKEVSLNQWKESYLNDKPDPFYNAEVGENLGVEIFTAQVEPYEITDQITGEVREVESITFPVIRGDNPKTILENRDLKLKGSAQSAPATQESEEETVEVDENSLV